MEEKEVGRNPFQDAKKEKKLRVLKNKLKQAKNIDRARSWLFKQKKIRYLLNLLFLFLKGFVRASVEYYRLCRIFH